jgi:ABC-type nitrate/sulfonate/bicarbonate transport system substrate-binding protein
MSMKIARARRFRLFVLVSALSLVASLAACSSSTKTASTSTNPAVASPTSTALETTSLNVVYGTAGSSIIPLWLATDEGLFAQHGLTVKTSLAASTVGATAVVSGGANVFVGEVTSAFQGVAEGQPLQLVGTFLTKSINKFYVSPKITSPSDLKGKSLAISATGDSTDLATRLVLAALKVSPSDVTLLPTGGSANRLAALISGNVAGSVLSEPSATKAKQAGMTLMYDQTTQPFADDGVTISTSFGKNNPNTVVAFLEGMVDAVKFMSDPANKQTVLNVLAKYTSAQPSDPAVLQGYNTYLAILAHDPYPDATAGNANLQGLQSEDPSRFGGLTLAKVYNTSFAQQLRTSGYIAKTWGSASAGGSPSTAPTS